MEECLSGQLSCALRLPDQQKTVACRMPSALLSALAVKTWSCKKGAGTGARALPGAAVLQVSCPTLPFYLARLSFRSDTSPVQHLYSECQRQAGTYLLAESASEGLVKCHL